MLLATSTARSEERLAVTREELVNVLEHRSGNKRLLGELLIQLGMVTEEQVKRALTRQTSEIRWRSELKAWC